MLLGVVIGAAASWGVTRHYYRRSLADAADSALASRLDDCGEGDATFLVALLQAAEPIPRYALINVEFDSPDGQRNGWASNTPTMARSVGVRAPQSLVYHGGRDIDEDCQTVSLSDRGRLNAEYLARKRYPTASFVSIDDSEPRRLALFRHEHGRDPRKGKLVQSGVRARWRSGG